MIISARFSNLPLMCVTITAFWLSPWPGLLSINVALTPRHICLQMGLQEGLDGYNY